MNFKQPQEDTPTTEFNILQNVLPKANRKIRQTEINLKMEQKPHRKDPSSKRQGELKQSAKNAGPDPGNQFCRKPV